MEEILLCKFAVAQRFGARAIVMRSLKEVCWKKFPFYIHLVHNNITMLLIPKVQNEASTSEMLLSKFISWKRFCILSWFWMFHIFIYKCIF